LIERDTIVKKIVSGDWSLINNSWSNKPYCDLVRAALQAFEKKRDDYNLVVITDAKNRLWYSLKA
jgi:hypothetical protein